MAKLFALAWTLAAALALSGCATSESMVPKSSQSAVLEIDSSDAPLVAQPSATPKAGASATGVDGSIFTVADPSRIVAVAPGSAEIIYSLGYGESLVGRDTTDNIPELSDVAVVTNTHSANLEKILSVAPSLIIVDANTRPIEVIERLVEADIQVAVIPVANSVESAFDRLQEIARLLGDENRADGLSKSLTQIAYEDTGIRAAFLYLRGQSAVYLIGGDGSGADAMIAAAGGIDVGEEAGLGAFTPLTPEALATLNPNVIVVMEAGLESVGGISGLLSVPGVAQTEAAKTNAVISIEDTLFLSFGARTSRVIQQLNAAFVQISSENA
jgi:iron complex transport system substrate-binding protein